MRSRRARLEAPEHPVEDFDPMAFGLDLDRDAPADVVDLPRREGAAVALEFGELSQLPLDRDRVRELDPQAGRRLDPDGVARVTQTVPALPAVELLVARERASDGLLRHGGLLEVCRSSL